MYLGFWEPIERKTYSLLATRSCLIFIIKVFRFNGRPYCYSSVSFSLLRSSVSNGRPYCYSSVSFSYYYFFFLTVFVPRISRKRLDRFSWNFHTWYLMIKCYYTFFCFDDVTSGFEISTILWFLIGHFVQIVSPKRVKIDIWNFHGW